MRTRSFAIIAVCLAVLLLGSAGVYAYDHARRDRIAQGVTVSGIDIGGMSPASAKLKLQRELLAPLQRTVKVRYGRKDYRVTARGAKITANIDATIDAAVERSRSGSIITRTVRNLTGGKVNANIAPKITYDRAAVTRMVSRVKRRVTRQAQDAKVNFGVTSFTLRRSHTGRRLDAADLTQKVEQAIVTPTSARLLHVHTHVVHPKITTAKLAQEYPVVLTVDRENFRLRLFKNLKLTKTYVVAVGQAGLDTPAGLYHIQNKAVDPDWHVPNSAWTGSLAGTVVPGGTPQNPLKARWLGIWDGAGIHGVDPSEYSSLGHAASHGCVRMRIDDVVQLYPQVPVGAPIYIA